MKKGLSEKLTLTKAARAAFSALKAYSWPDTWRQTAASLCMTYFITMPAARLLPDAEEYFKSEGMDPSIPAALTDRPVHISGHDAKSAAYALIQMPHILLQASSILAHLNAPAATSSWPAHRLDPYSLVDGKHYFLVQAPDLKRMGNKEAFALYAGLPEHAIERAGINAADLDKFILLREIRRSATANEKAAKQKLAVADADEAALRSMAPEISRTPSIVKAIINYRAISHFIKNKGGNPVHNPVLYLDATFRGAAPPSMAQSADAAKEIYQHLKTHLRENDSRPNFIRYTEAFRAMLAEDGLLSPCAKRLAELFVEATEYHAPTAVGGKTRPQTAYSLPAPGNPATKPILDISQYIS